MASRSRYLRELAGYWAQGFDWRAREAELNELPQFVTAIDGQELHFMHVRSPEPDALPLLLIHGWPSSPVEFLRLIEPLRELRPGDPVAAGLRVLHAHARGRAGATCSASRRLWRS